MPTDTKAAIPASDTKYMIVVKDGRGPQVGPFPPFNATGQPTVFSRSQFAKLHPAPKKGADDADVPTPEEYHDGLLQRLLDMKAIAPLNPVVAVVDRPADPVPPGPEAAAAQEAAKRAADAERAAKAVQPPAK